MSTATEQSSCRPLGACACACPRCISPPTTRLIRLARTEISRAAHLPNSGSASWVGEAWLWRMPDGRIATLTSINCHHERLLQSYQTQNSSQPGSQNSHAPASTDDRWVVESAKARLDTMELDDCVSCCQCLSTLPAARIAGNLPGGNRSPSRETWRPLRMVKLQYENHARLCIRHTSPYSGAPYPRVWPDGPPA
jgi:ferredoxin